MDTAPTSFSITTILLPWSEVSILLTRLVFPLPKKPVTIVTGVLMMEEESHVKASGSHHGRMESTGGFSLCAFGTH